MDYPTGPQIDPKKFDRIIKLLMDLNKKETTVEVKAADPITDINWPTDPKNPIAVQLSDGERFYKAVQSIVAGGGVQSSLITDNRLNVNPGGFAPAVFDEVAITYVPASTRIDTVTWKLLGVDQVAIQLSYDGSNNLIDVVTI
jgi:hypothetical protein